MYFRTPYNYNHYEEKTEINTQPSEVCPDETVTVREMLQQYVRGIPPAIARNVEYDDDGTYDDVDMDALDPLNSLGFDLADSQVYSDDLNARYQSLNESKKQIETEIAKKQSLSRKKTDKDESKPNEDKQSTDE